MYVKYGCSIYFFLISASLICRGMDISKYSREFHGLQDQERGLYFVTTKILINFVGFKVISIEQTAES